MLNCELDQDTYAEVFAVFCDAIQRGICDIPDEDPFMHTGDEARRLAFRAMDHLGLVPDAESEAAMDPKNWSQEKLGQFLAYLGR